MSRSCVVFPSPVDAGTGLAGREDARTAVSGPEGKQADAHRHRCWFTTLVPRDGQPSMATSRQGSPQTESGRMKSYEGLDEKGRRKFDRQPGAFAEESSHDRGAAELSKNFWVLT